MNVPHGEDGPRDRFVLPCITLRKGRPMKAFALALLIVAGVAMPADAAARRARVTGEVIDSWCQITGIMYALGTAHHLCALWCAAGGIPVGIRADDGRIYVILKLQDDDTNVASPSVLRIQTHRVTAEGDLYERDGVRYLVVNRIVEDEGIVNRTHSENGIQPFGK